MVKKEKVFILKKTVFRERDLILHGLNSTGSKVSVVARGARKSVKRFGGGILEPTHFVEWVYSKKETQDLGELKEAHMKYDFKGLRTSYDRLKLGLYFLRLIEFVSLQDMPTNSSMFNLLGHGLKLSETTSHLLRLKTHFEIKFLFEQGVLCSQEFVSYLKHPLKEHLNLEILDCKKQIVSKSVASYLDRKFDMSLVSLEN